MTELALRNDNTGTVLPAVPAPTATGAMRLVEWAEEAQAASHLARALSGTPFAGSWKNDPDGATAAILKGAEIGLTPVTALSAFDNIQGTPAPKAITLRALVQSHGHDLEIVEETDERAVARYRRNGRGDWQTTTFTIENARAMKLLGKDNWQKQPGAMLIARVTSKAARLVASDVILGIGYSAEEIRDLDPHERQLPSLPAAAEEPRGLAAALADQDASRTSEPDRPANDDGITAAQLRKVGATMRELGITDRDNALLYVFDVVGRQVDSRNDLTKAEAGAVIEALEADLPSREDQAQPAEPDGADQ